MNLAAPFIQRPVASGLIATAILLLGMLCWRLLPVSPLPAVDFPMIVVTANLPGASPESMAATVATPLERALGSIAGVQRMGSSSSQGSTQIRLEFALDRNVDEAAREVQAAINSARSQLPSGMTSNPTYRKMNPSSAPVMALALSSNTVPGSQLYDTASTILAQKLATIQGVGEVGVSGSSLPAVRVQLNPGMLAHYGVALDEVRSALSSANANVPLGVLELDDQRWQVAASETMRSAKDYTDLVVKYVNDAPIRLSDIAKVSDSTENRYSAGFHNDKDAVILLVSRRTGANIVETIDLIYSQMPQLQALVPDGASLTVVMDRSPGIRATLDEAQITLLIAVALVVLVVWVFLGQLRSALIPSLAIPVSLVGAFAVMYLCDFSLNNLSVMALIVATGLVVDDAIVVVENIKRHIERGLSPLQAARTGAAEVSATLLAMNLALVVIFLSLLFMGGLVERLFREFSITLAAAMVISLLVSLTLTPSLSALILKADRSHTDSAGFFTRLQQKYQHSVAWSLEHYRWVLLVLALLMAATGWLYTKVPTGLLPEQDTGQLNGFVRGDDGMSFQVMQPKIEAFRQHILKDPAVADVTGSSGGDTGISNSWMRVRLKPLAERKVSAQEVVNRLRMTAPKVPGGMMFMGVDQDIRLSSPFSRSDYEVLMLADDIKLLKTWSKKVAERLQELPELTDVDTPSGDDTQ